VGPECSVEFFCVNILLLCVQGLCEPAFSVDVRCNVCVCPEGNCLISM